MLPGDRRGPQLREVEGEVKCAVRDRIEAAARGTIDEGVRPESLRMLC